MKVQLKTPEEIEASDANLRKVIQPHILKSVNRYNKWVKQKQRAMRVFRPRPWRTDLKKPFKYTNVFYAKKDSDITDNPEIAEMEANAGPRIE